MKTKILPLFSAVVLSYFGIKKLMASEVSVTEFTKFGTKIDIDPYGFMYFTGAMEMVTVLLIILSLFESSKKHLLGLTGHAMLIGTMVGAMATEFYIRDEAKYPLVGLTLVLLGISAYYFHHHKTQLIIRT